MRSLQQLCCALTCACSGRSFFHFEVHLFTFCRLTLRLALLSGVLALTAGCAVHYSDAKSGAEHLWGFGQLRLKNEDTSNQFAVVVTGFRAPGLCLEIGRDHFGFTFGYLNRQRLAVVSTNAIAALEFPTVSSGVSSGNTNAPWAFGHLRMRTVPAPAHHYAIVTGKALAGLGAGLGSHDNSFGIVLDGRQRAVVLDENIHLDFDQDAPRWPGFDLFAMHVESPVSNDSNENSTRGEP